MKNIFNKEKIKSFFLRFKNKEMFIVLGIIIVGIIIDQVTKYIASTYLEYGQTKEILGSFFGLTYIRNKGAAWGMFQDTYWLLGIITIIALGFLIYGVSFINFKKKPFYSISIPLIISGTLGNMVERSARAFGNGEGVIDFLDFKFFNYNFPVFNIADSLLVAGMILLIIHFTFTSDKKITETKKENSNMKEINVACAVLLKDNKVLACKRGPGRALEGKWEFPGGKIENGESPSDTIVRELKEELKIKVIATGNLGSFSHVYKDEDVKPFSGFKINMEAVSCFLVNETEEIQLTEHTDYKWLAIDELDTVEWADADKPLVQKIKEFELLG